MGDGQDRNARDWLAEGFHEKIKLKKGKAKKEREAVLSSGPYSELAERNEREDSRAMVTGRSGRRLVR